jgi:hypothetical protein
MTIYSWRLDLDGNAHAPRLARHSLRPWLELVGCNDVTTADVTIVVSELVTHDVANDAARVSIRALFDDGRLRLDLHARHRATAPHPADISSPDDSCQSVIERVVAAATDAWGRTRTPHETHTWAEILC